MCKLKIISLLIVVFLIGSCQAQLRHWVDVEPGVDFSSFNTYSIDDQCSDYSPGVNPLNQQRIKNALELQLRDLGYVKSEDPDLMIKFFIKNETKSLYQQCLPLYRNFKGGDRCIERAYDYEVGTLVIDLIDVRNNLAVWHGGGQGASWEKMKDPDSKIQRMVKTIMSDYKKLVEL